MNIYYLIPPRKEWIISTNVEHKIKRPYRYHGYRSENAIIHLCSCVRHTKPFRVVFSSHPEWY